MSRRKPSEQHVVQALLDAYRHGFFPMADPEARPDRERLSHIDWCSPDPRGVLPLSEDEGFHAPRRLEQHIRSGRFIIRFDTAFARVMEGCARPRRRRRGEGHDGGWIDSTILEWYCTLARHGCAHSIEAWRTDPRTGRESLVGGVYGVSLGAAFFGESMFHIARARRPDGSQHPLDGTNASSVCLVTLVRHLAACGYRLFDTQMVTDHVARFGACLIPREMYLKRLAEAINEPDRWRPIPRATDHGSA